MSCDPSQGLTVNLLPLNNEEMEGRWIQPDLMWRTVDTAAYKNSGGERTENLDSSTSAVTVLKFTQLQVKVLVPEKY